MSNVLLTATNPEDSSVVPVACNEKGELKLEEPASFDGNLAGDLTVTGNGSFDGDVEAPRLNAGVITNDVPALTAINGSAGNAPLYVRNNNGGTAPGIQVAGGDGSAKATINNDGSATFTNGKAGFTAEGNLWCTTVRGDTVILDATSNGIGSWQPYTPPTRREIIEQKVQNIKDAAIKPSQELPEE